MLKFLFITILILWLIRILARFLLPIIFQRVVNKAQQQFGQQFQQQQYQQRPPRQKDTVHIEHVPEKPKQSRGDNGGEFVDFEEIK